MKLSEHDRSVLRGLAARRVESANSPVNIERRNAWHALDEGGPGMRPMVLAEASGCGAAIPELANPTLECTEPDARGLEQWMRWEQWRFDSLQDDHVVEPFFNTAWKIRISDFGINVPVQRGEYDGHMGSAHWDPPIKDLDRDLHLLKPRTFTVDREGTLQKKAELEALFGDILPVRIRGAQWWTAGLTNQTVSLHGLDSFMLSMYDNPDGVHRLMKFLCDDFLALTEGLEREGLLTLNNENDYIGSGSEGYTRALPHPGKPAGPASRREDLWVLLESQPTVGVGPLQYEEFVFPYHLRIAEVFGRTYYGCCEGLQNLMPILRRLPNLKRVSVSPWADQAKMAAECGRELVFSRKPIPTLISTERFDEAAIRKDLRDTMAVARSCRLEIIMKDVHTLGGDGTRLSKWVRIAREETGTL